MNRNFSTVLSVAAGVGLLAGTTGVLLYHYVLGRRYVFVLEQDINRLHLSLENLRCEFEDLKNLKEKDGKSRRSKRNLKFNASSGSTTSFTDASMYSALETDDEFCDISNSEDENTLVLSSFPTPVTMASENQTIVISDEIKKLSVSGDAENQNAPFADIDKLLEGDDENKTKAYQLLEELVVKNNADSEVLWRMARASHALSTIAEAKGDSDKKQQYINQGIEYGQRALDGNSKNANAHKWYGICVGARGQFSDTKTKIKDGTVFKEHIEEAIKLNPGDPALYNLLGRFEFEVSQLSMMERKVASWLFAEVPKGTVENAIADFQKTEELNPKPWKENRLLLGKCYIAQKQYDVAVKWLDKALEVPAITSEEKKFDEEIKKLIKKYESYRKS
ncbi:regulator of microtubule dynamics protein 1-like isoform X2 [Planococcus citri]